MDTRGFDDSRHEHARPTDSGVGEASVQIGTDERRMHVRAYNHWVSLLKGRAYPAIDDLDPAASADFGPHGVLLDFSGGNDDPTIRYLGQALRDECGLDHNITRVAEVPARSLLSRLTDHYLQIIANRAPIGFEAEFVGTRGHNMMYRGILMPFSSDGEHIDHVYGVINWKEVATSEVQATLAAELSAAVRGAPRGGEAIAAGVWADGPSAAGADEEPAATAPQPDDATPEVALPDCLVLARDAAAAAATAEARSRAALYRALGRAHDLALAGARDPAGLAALLREAGVAGPRASMLPIVKLVFGSGHDRARLSEMAAVLAAARAAGVPAGGLGRFLDRHPGGIKGVVAAQRAARRTPRTAA